MTRSPHEILGVQPNATPDQLAAAWKSFARVWHPDKFAARPAAERAEVEEKFRDAKKAYDLLSKPVAQVVAQVRFVDLPYEATRHGGRLSVEVPLGEGRTRVVVLDVPRGVRPGYQWRFGDDLVVELRHSQIWSRKRSATSPTGWDLHGFLRVTLDEILTGAEVTVDGPQGRAIAVTLPKHELKPLRLKGHGHYLPGFVPGDLVLELDVAWPELDARQLGELKAASVNS